MSVLFNTYSSFEVVRTLHFCVYHLFPLDISLSLSHHYLPNLSC